MTKKFTTAEILDAYTYFVTAFDIVDFSAKCQDLDIYGAFDAHSLRKILTYYSTHYQDEFTDVTMNGNPL